MNNDGAVEQQMVNLQRHADHGNQVQSFGCLQNAA